MGYGYLHDPQMIFSLKMVPSHPPELVGNKVPSDCPLLYPTSDVDVG